MWAIEQCPFFFWFQGRFNLNLGIMKYFKNNDMVHVNVSWIWGNQFYRCKTKEIRYEN
jgi:hypothetical protein